MQWNESETISAVTHDTSGENPPEGNGRVEITTLSILAQSPMTTDLISEHRCSSLSFFYSCILVIFVTAVGNILVCLAIARERKLQNTTNYFLMSLAVADCLVAILVMPMGMIAEALGSALSSRSSRQTSIDSVRIYF